MKRIGGIEKSAIYHYSKTALGPDGGEKATQALSRWSIHADLDSEVGLGEPPNVGEGNGHRHQ